MSRWRWPSTAHALWSPWSRRLPIWMPTRVPWDERWRKVIPWVFYRKIWWISNGTVKGIWRKTAKIYVYLIEAWSFCKWEKNERSSSVRWPFMFFLFFLRNVDQCSRVCLDGNQATVCNWHDSRCITAVHVWSHSGIVSDCTKALSWD